MFTIREIDHLVLRVRDLEAMVTFYCDVIGCQVDRRRDDLGLVHLRAGRSLIDLVSVDGKLGQAGGAAPGSQGHNVDHFCLRIDPYDESALRQHLAAAGVKTGKGGVRYGAEGLGPSLFLSDPEGNTVELRGPPEVPAS
ncbi:MAG: VOC family protein [Pseudomonadota bacterium]